MRLRVTVPAALLALAASMTGTGNAASPAFSCNVIAVGTDVRPNPTGVNSVAEVVQAEIVVTCVDDVLPIYWGDAQVQIVNRTTGALVCRQELGPFLSVDGILAMTSVVACPLLVGNTNFGKNLGGYFGWSTYDDPITKSGYTSFSGPFSLITVQSP